MFPRSSSYYKGIAPKLLASYCSTACLSVTRSSINFPYSAESLAFRNLGV